MKTSLLFIFSVFLHFSIFAQSNTSAFSVLFYNVENLFDVQNDSLSNDEEFTTSGARYWTYYRMERKLLNTSKAILNAAGWEAPGLIALCEVENRYVFERLQNDTPLKNIPYKIIHKESPDHRGIDVGLLYNTEKFYPLSYEYFPLQDKNGEVMKTREILYVSGIVDGADTIHIFINHWPSRYSGVMETRELRIGAATLLKEKIQSVQLSNKRAKIIVVGDFNDNPDNESMINILGAAKPTNNHVTDKLYNLSLQWQRLPKGTLKYQSQWFVFDQIIVSGELLRAESGLFTKPEWAEICELPFLLEQDNTHGGTKPFRTYSGYKYNGGFSDHLPVLLKLEMR